MQTAGTTPSVPLDDPSLYLNRELSWLEFNRRVLEEAQDPQVPLLERLKFLAIFSSNLDEFFMVRVGGLQQKVQAGITFGSGGDKMPAHEQLERISTVVRQLVAEEYRCLHEEVLPGLQREGIALRGLNDLTDADKRHLHEVFRREVFPVVTPLAIDPGHPFPHLLNKSLNLAVLLRRVRRNRGPAPSGETEPVSPGDKLFAVVQVPAVLSRFVPLPADKGHVFTTLETVIRMHLPELFAGMEVEHAVVFRVTRDSDFEIDDDEVQDLLKTIEEEVRKRRRGMAVRLQIEADAPAEIEQKLLAALDVEPLDVYRAPGMLDLTGLFQIHNLAGYPHLRDPHFVPQPVPEFVKASNPWSAIRARDILMHHPYESFAPVVDFIAAAADDEKVLAIKQTLYRTSSDSPIVRALQRAADNGKQVTAVIELKARLDEERNILWARELEKAGVHVVFGFIGLKTHCKVALVVRKEEDGLRRYVHLGTGNYNPQTARLYTDLGYFTCNPDFAEDASALFNYLTGYSELPQWRKLVVAPSRLLPALHEKIQQEMRHQSQGKQGRIIAKINGLMETSVVQSLYKASQAGVKIDLICRGICALRPGLPGVSENIRVISIVDRFLEHSRIYYFGNGAESGRRHPAGGDPGGEPQVFIGSADWMDRNLSRRVEVVFPVEQPDLKDRLINEILAISLADNVKARELLSDGSYRRVQPQTGQPRVRSQERFLELAVQNTLRKLQDDGPAVPVLAPVMEANGQPAGEAPARPRRRRQTS